MMSVMLTKVSFFFFLSSLFSLYFFSLFLFFSSALYISLTVRQKTLRGWVYDCIERCFVLIKILLLRFSLHEIGEMYLGSSYQKKETRKKSKSVHLQTLSLTLLARSSSILSWIRFLRYSSNANGSARDLAWKGNSVGRTKTLNN